MDDQTLDQILANLETIQATAAAAIALARRPVTIVHGGENLQAALDRGGQVALEPGAIFPGTYIVKTPGTTVDGAGAAIRASAGPAIKIPPGARDIAITLGDARTTWDQAVIEVGENTSAQTTVAAAPARITLTIHVPVHRGKRAFSIHGADVTLGGCTCADVYDPAGRDSQGIWIGNAPGPVLVLGGSFEAGSENILVGGDRVTIPGLIPTGLTFDGVTLTKPATWQTDGINRGVKNLFELKSGADVTLKRATLTGCWVAAQTGYAIVITPRNGARIANVLIEDVLLRSASSVLNLIGWDNEAPSGHVDGVTIRRLDSIVTRGIGDGRLAMFASEPTGLVIEDCAHQGDGTSTLYHYYGTVVAADGTKRSGGPCLGFRFTGNRSTFGRYGLISDSGAAFAANWRTAFPDGVITGNTLIGADPQTQKNLPGNTFV